jgi:hypothetical protein
MSHKTAATVAQTIGIDTGKNTLHLIGLDDQGAIVLREKIARGRIAVRLANLPRCLIGIEAGMATHYVARMRIDLSNRLARGFVLRKSGGFKLRCGAQITVFATSFATSFRSAASVTENSPRYPTSPARPPSAMAIALHDFDVSTKASE